ncbi:cupin domain-containing protein [Rhizobiaceae bacterium n13]|uniref:Cupin domain-containing protein n=1 Tax=Ferirhizobium litorale TaxID=2927786 RepID=A0AAE3QKJ2_9HYPH|nr:cupin domain-containing protein [Fererhizobium litorale]MDI7864585.1 cupin domain-containing protein [Fererhizobium litorale]MDI7924874.1 cupin domain-containing protein [Fererhizobium litorale]
MAWKMMLASAVAMVVRSVPVVVPGSPPRPFVAGASDRMVLKPAPIDPSWIVNGNPVARVGEHSRSADEAGQTAIWDCTAGEFRWFFHWDETVMILEGEVHVTTEDGTVSVLRAGDIGYFAGGTWATWRIDTYVRKIAFLRKPFPAPVAMAYRLRSALRALKNTGRST